MASSVVPLHCSICPKKPNFSDVSHLLTHIASKGHLSHYYKIKVRSSSDQASKNQIEAYDAWYSRWNVEELMSDRMHHKDKKRTRSIAQASTSKPQKKKAANTNNWVLDPTLDGTVSRDTDTPPVFQPYHPSQGFVPYDVAASEPRKYLPKKHLWSTQRPGSYAALQIEFSPLLSNAASPPFQDQGYTPAFTSTNSLDDGGEEEEDEVAAEAAKLKGVLWPGMDIFDSATLEMRKKRNQKKDVSVVENLEYNSQGVEPTELVFFQSGDFKKQRKISGRMDLSSSEIEPASPSPPQRRNATRPVLAELDTNSSAAPLPSSLTYMPSVMSERRAPEAQMRPSERKNAVRGNKAGNTPRTVGIFKKKMPVFRDGEHHASPEPAHGMNTLTSEFRLPQENDPRHQYGQYHFQPCHFTNPSASYGTQYQTYAPFQPYQTYYSHPAHNPWETQGFDLSALLVSHLGQEPQTPCTDAFDKKYEEQEPHVSERDNALTISDYSDR